MSEHREFMSILILLANIGILALNLKLYTEWWKERVKR